MQHSSSESLMYGLTMDTKKIVSPTLYLPIVLSKVPEDARGRKRLDIPVGHAVLDNARKALRYLAECQAGRLVHPNTAYTSSTNNNADVKKMIDRHLENDLIRGTMKARQDKGESCKFRDSYSNVEHLRMLSYTWSNAGLVTAPLIREHLAVAASHGMLLRGEDLRGLAFANCFIQQIPKGRLDSHPVHMLTFVLEEGKTIVGERKEYAGAVRHEDVRRCVVGAFAFYVYDRFHVSFFFFFFYKEKKARLPLKFELAGIV
jgi:hypothetical protein